MWAFDWDTGTTTRIALNNKVAALGHVVTVQTEGTRTKRGQFNAQLRDRCRGVHSLG